MHGLLRLLERGLERVPGEARALDADGKRAHAGECCELAHRGLVDLLLDRHRHHRLIASVISEADAFEIAQPDPSNDTPATRSPSSFKYSTSRSPHSGLCPSARRSNSAIAPKLRGRLLWSRMTSW